MTFIQKLFTSRANSADGSTYVGETDRIWWDPARNGFYYSDGVTPGGILIGTGGGGGPDIDLVVSDTPPLNPTDGLLWFDLTTGIEYRYINDGDSSQWVASTGPAYIGPPGPQGGVGPAGPPGPVSYAEPASKLDVNGPIATELTTQTGSTYSVLETDSSLIANYAGTITYTLPTASACAGRVLNIRTITNNTVVSATSNVVPLAGGAAGTAVLSATAGKWAMLQSDGANWQTMAGK